MRQIYLSRTQNVPVMQSIHPRERMKFEMGKMLEEVVKKWMRELDIVVDHEHVKDPELKIIGHEDVRFKNGTIGEIKAIDPALFRLAAKYPLKHHQFQVETYLNLDKQFKEAKLLSFSYGNETMPFRDQTVRFNLKTNELVKRTVGTLREAEAGGVLPGRACKGASDARAAVCPVVRQCFQLDSSGIAQTIKQIIEKGRIDG